MADKPYDVFISYSSLDRPWAIRLDQDLRAKGLKVFLDKSELEAGSDWKERLKEALRNTRYFVGLWSKHAFASKWVDHEAIVFDVGLERPEGGMVPIQQRMIFILLEDQPVAYTDLQMIEDFKEAQVYDPNAKDAGLSNADQKDPNLWPYVVEKVYKVVTLDEPLIPIPLLILTTTRDRMLQIDSTQPPDHLGGFAESLDDLLQRLKITKKELVDRYDKERTEWKPWGCGQDIMTILNLERDRINKLPKAAKFRWAPLTDKFWSGTQPETVAEINKLLAPNLAVIVIDPIAFYDPRVYSRFNMLGDCLNNGLAIIIVLAPFSLPEASRVFREAVQKISLDLFDYYYEPGVKRIPYARCSVNFGDDLDIKRSLLATLRSHFNQVQTQSVHPHLSMGKSN